MDIKPSWKTATEAKIGYMFTNADLVAKYIFSGAINVPASFAVNGMNQFTDTHTIVANVKDHVLIAAFTSSAIIANKVGYEFTQDYKCGQNGAIGETLGIAHIARQWVYSPSGYLDWNLQKRHSL